MNTAREFISDMAEHISLPAVYLNLRKLMKNPQAMIGDYAAIIEKDSMLATRIMRISKSEFFGFSRKTENLIQAISLIGVMQLHDVILSCLCMRTFSSFPRQIINLKDFWEYSIQCGIAARIIAKQSGLLTSNQFFTLGILHEVGHVAIYVKAPEASVWALENHRAQNDSIIKLEREFLGFDYSQLGSEMMRLWDLPETYLQVAAHHLQPQHANALYRPAVQIVHLAHAICQNPVAGAHRELITYTASTSQQLKSLPDNIDEMVLTAIDNHSASVLSMLWPCGSQQLPLHSGGASNG